MPIPPRLQAPDAHRPGNTAPHPAGAQDGAASADPEDADQREAEDDQDGEGGDDREGDPAADPGVVGNLMIDRMVGAHIHLVGEAEFAEVGGWGLVEGLREKLKQEGGKPYCFPSGG